MNSTHDPTQSRNTRVDSRSQPWPESNHLLSMPPTSPILDLPALPTTPLVSVVIPTQNRPRLLKDALASLVGQTYRNWEAIVVNDGGEDVQHVIAEIGNDPRIRLLTHWRKLGQSCARNTALRVAQGQIICFLDDDDRYLPTHIEGIVITMRQSPDPFIFTGAVKISEQLTKELRIELGRADIEDSLQTPQDRLLVWNFIPLPTWAHRKECLNQVGFFDEGMTSHEDWDFLLRFAQIWTLRHVNQNTVEIRIRPTSNDGVTTRNEALKLRDFHFIYDRYPTSSRKIKSLRREVLAELGERRAFGAIHLAFRKLMNVYNRNIGWRFHTRSEAKRS